MRLLIIVFFTSFFSCSNEKDLTLLASYKDNHLYLDEVLSNIEEEIKDTADYIDKYIDSWVRKNVLLDHANSFVDQEDSEILDMVQEYKENIIIHKYRQSIIRNKFDTTVSDKEIEAYYEDIYKKDFDTLSNDIIKAKLVILENNINDLEYLKSLINAKRNSLEMKNLIKFCKLYADYYFLNDVDWVNSDQIFYKLPDLDENQYEKVLLEKNKIHSFTKDNYYYILFVKDYQIKGDKLPLSYALNNIRELLIETKKMNFIKKVEEDFYNQAVLSKDIKIY